MDWVGRTLGLRTSGVEEEKEERGSRPMRNWDVRGEWGLARQGHCNSKAVERTLGLYKESRERN